MVNNVLTNQYTGVKLSISKLPGRKQACFVFTEENDSLITPAAYIPDVELSNIERLWGELLEGVPMGEKG